MVSGFFYDEARRMKRFRLELRRRLCTIADKMIRKLTVDGFTVFPTATSLTLEPGINILVGGNGSGKSHLMKLAYALCKWGASGSRKELPVAWAEEKRLRQLLLRVFALRDLADLTARDAAPCTASVRASLMGDKVPLGSAETAFTFHSGGEEDGLTLQSIPDRVLSDNAVFLAPREVLSIFPIYTQAGRRYPELLDSAGWDLCTALENEVSPVLPSALAHVLRQIESMLHGKLIRRNGRFFLQQPGEQPLELTLAAEGFKRLGTLGLLIANGSVRSGTTLFWDEPEMNLHTTHLPLLVGIMLGLCRAGVQVILSTHSLFLLREITIQLADTRNRNVARRFFGLQAGRRGSEVMPAATLAELDRLDILDAEAAQADRYLSLADALFSTADSDA